MKLVIFGTGKIADILYTYIKETSDFQVAGFTVDAKYLSDKTKFSLPVVPFEDVAKNFPPKECRMIVAIGYHDLNRVRAERCAAAKAKGYKLASYVDRRAVVSPGVPIGENCIILDNVTVEPFAKIGDNVCIYSGATVAHHSTVKDNVWITSGTVVGGNSTVGRNAFLGINATIGHNITLGDDNFIGAGALVTKNTKDKAVHICEDTPPYRLNSDQFLKLFKFD